MLCTTPPERVDAAYERIVSRVRAENDSEEEVGLPPREVWAEMSASEKQERMETLGRRWTDLSLGPEAAERARVERARLEIDRMKARKAPAKEIKAQSDIGKIQADINAGLVDPRQGAQQIANILDRSKGTPAPSQEDRDRSQYIQLSTMQEAGEELSTQQQKRLDILTRKYGEELPTINDMMSEIMSDVLEGKPLTPQKQKAYQLFRDPFQLMLAQALGAPMAPMSPATPVAPAAPTPGQPPQQGAANEITRQTRDGRIAVFDAQTKKFLRYQ